MAYIDYVPDDDSTPVPLRRLYDRYRELDGTVDNIVKIHGPNPPSMEGHVRYYHTIMRGASPLTRAQREMIAVVVSVANDCHY